MIYTATPFFWEHMLDAPIARRLAPAPAELVEFVAQYNRATGNASVPGSAAPGRDFADDAGMAIEELPLQVKNKLAPCLIGVFFMKGLGSSAVTDVVARANGDIIGAVVMLDIDVFSDRKANEWASWRDNTPFIAVPDVRLEVLIADASDDNRKSALQYVLLHEFGHVLAAGSGLLPDWWTDASAVGKTSEYGFLQKSWQIDQESGRIIPVANEDFALRDQVAYYAQAAQLSGAHLPSIYADLGRTGFPTLYAASSVHEDFAESFSTYVHSVLLEKRLELNIYQNGQLLAQGSPYWGTARSKSKGEVFEALLAPADTTPARRSPGHAATAALLAVLAQPDMPFLGLAPFARMSVAGGDLQYVAQTLLDKAATQQDNPQLWMNLSTACFALGQDQAGKSIQGQALMMQRTYTVAAARQPARLRLLMLVAAGDLAENMPLDCLLEDSDIDLIYYYATLDAPLPADLPPHDALLVATSYTEHTRPIIDALDPLLKHWRKPVLNQPQQVHNTERSTASAMLQQAPGIAMPPTWQISRDVLQAIASDSAALGDRFDGCRFPVILRPVGSHAGRDLVKIDDAGQIAAYLSAVAEPSFYLSRFIDYSGEDGLFRKYRIALIAGRPYASHMAISSHWMIHYVNAGMYEEQAKRMEEAAWMQNFAAFAARHGDALNAIWQRSGLDYVCIDCAETVDGQLLIFEIDHAMVVHAMDPEDLFPYKQDQMRKVKSAFENLLYSLAPAVMPHQR